MIQSLPSIAPLLITIVLTTMAIGLPILTLLAIRFLLDRNLNLGRSRELEKLIWQLHRIASAMENQTNSSVPPAQPATEKPRDPANAQQPTTQSVTPSPSVAPPPAAPASAAQQATASPPTPREPVAEGERPGGVNSMFGL
jgi:uncharacterized membrane protein